MKTSKIFLAFGFLFVLGLVIYFPWHKWARVHVNSKTATEDHPLFCISCHLYTSRSKLVSKLVNSDYYSPFNMAVSKNGDRLYVVAQEGNELLENTLTALFWMMQVIRAMSATSGLIMYR
jgi:hypothetical protein